VSAAPDAAQWIVVPNWREFQHYRDRHPPWIKLHLSLLTDERFNALAPRLQMILIRLWLAYSQNDRGLSAGTSSLSLRASARVTSKDIKTLCDAGFLELRASPLLNGALDTEKRREERGKRASAEEKKRTASADIERATFTFPGGPVLADVCPECGVGGGRHTADCVRAVLG